MGAALAERTTEASGRAATEAAIELVYREDAGRLTATLIRSCGGDFQLAEDSLQDAFATALERWPADGVPNVPAAWILTTGRRKAIDRLRRDQTLQRKRDALQRLAVLEQQLSEDEVTSTSDGEAGVLVDDRLRLIFTCCHPALAPEAQVALTLRTVAVGRRTHYRLCWQIDLVTGSPVKLVAVLVAECLVSGNC